MLIYYIIIDLNKVDMRIYLSVKRIQLLGVDKSSCLPELKSIAALLYDFLTMYEKVLLSLFCT